MNQDQINEIRRRAEVGDARLSDVPDLVAEIERLRAALEAIKRPHGYWIDRVACTGKPCGCGAEEWNAKITEVLRG